MEEMVMQQLLSIPATYEKRMTPEIARRVSELKATLDIHDKGKVIACGREEQASIGEFYDSLLRGVGTTEVGEAGELLAKVIGDMKGYKATCDKENTGFLAFLRKQKSKIQTIQTKFKPLADNMATVVKELQKKDMALAQVSRNFDVMYAKNSAMYEFLTMVIYAGEQLLQEEKQKLAVIKQEADESGDLMEVQKASDFNDDILRFDRRLFDLKKSRAIAIQQATQIKTAQKGADEVSETIKTTIDTTIPLWKSLMALALNMDIIGDGLNAVNAAKDATNAMLIANAEMNKKLTLEVAQAVERGVVDIETINAVNQNMIDALSGSYEIAQKAITSREEGAKQLIADEAELKEAIVKYTNLN